MLVVVEVKMACHQMLVLPYQLDPVQSGPSLSVLPYGPPSFLCAALQQVFSLQLAPFFAHKSEE